MPEVLRKYQNAILSILLVIIVGIIYSGAIKCFFTQDDFWWLHTAVSSKNIGDIIRPFIQYNGSGFYRPLTQEMYFLANYKLFGLTPIGFHVVNLLVQIINTVLVFLILLKLGKSAIASWLAALFYGINSALFVSVYWISAVSESGMALFALLAIMNMIDYYQKQDRKSYLFSIAFTLAALASKETAVVIPGLLIIIYLYLNPPLSINNLKQALWLTLPHIILVMIYLLIHFMSVGLPASGPYAAKINGMIIINLGKYIIWSLNRLDITLSIIGRFASHRIYGIALIAALFIFISLVFMFVHRRRDTIFAGTWFLLSLLPVMLIVGHAQVYYVNLALIGICCLFASAFDMTKDWPMNKRIITGVLLCVIIIYSSSINIGEERSHSWVTRRADLARKGLNSLKHYYPTLPGDAKLYLVNASEDARWAYDSGSVFDLYYNNSMPVVFTNNLSGVKAKREKYAFIFNDGELIDIAQAEKLAQVSSLEMRSSIKNYINMANDIDVEQLGKGWHGSARDYRWMAGRADVYLANPNPGENAHEIHIAGIAVLKHLNGNKIRMTLVIDNAVIAERVISKGGFNIRIPFKMKLPAICHLEIRLDDSHVLDKYKDHAAGQGSGLAIIRIVLI